MNILKFKPTYDCNEEISFEYHKDFVAYVSKQLSNKEKAFVCFQTKNKAFIAALNLEDNTTRSVGWAFGGDDMQDRISHEIKGLTLNDN